jgi:hypothetical protein
MGYKNKKHHRKHSTETTESCSFVPDYSSKMLSSVKKTHYKTHVKSESHSVPRCNKGCGCACKCEMKYYFPLPTLPTQPVSERVGPLNWLAPGSVQSCCSICSTVRPVYANPCDSCAYDRKVCPINNTAYFTTGEYNV